MPNIDDVTLSTNPDRCDESLQAVIFCVVAVDAVDAVAVAGVEVDAVAACYVSRHALFSYQSRFRRHCRRDHRQKNVAMAMLLEII
jgi:hypothetical protein